MDFGPQAKTIAAAARARKHPIPEDAIPPPIPAECGFAYAAFQELSTTRQMGFGLGPIPWTAINDYAWRYGIVATDHFDHLVTFVRAMDEAWLGKSSKPKP